ncbi:hypothetical protein BXZ70DRAFT_262864 [Cristinia sonorae]|uniref:Uncharacterized protein n=1 Tax=Cristinia sonorae TaxID=1940300 RepID=A0A8K0XU82_9AGAR|nr:hypothetical protein BXZ70DRAFT_262864 [Cristinia sonorae]
MRRRFTVDPATTVFTFALTKSDANQQSIKIQRGVSLRGFLTIEQRLYTTYFRVDRKWPRVETFEGTRRDSWEKPSTHGRQMLYIRRTLISSKSLRPTARMSGQFRDVLAALSADLTQSIAADGFKEARTSRVNFFDILYSDSELAVLPIRQKESKYGCPYPLDEGGRAEGAITDAFIIPPINAPSTLDSQINNQLCVYQMRDSVCGCHLRVRW